MSWLISLLIAGSMLSSDGNLSNYFQANNNHADYTKTKNVRISERDETERFEQTYPLSRNGRVSVSNVNGSITVEGWDRSEVKLEYVKTAETKERLAEVKVKIEAQANSFNVEADFDDEARRANGNGRNNRYKSAEVEFRLMVPRAAVLNEIETVNGSVSVSKTTNSAKVSAVNGAVNASNISGTAELSTVNGAVTADFERLDDTSQIKLETVNGQAFLTLPSDANATVRAETVNGKISNDFGLPVRKGKFVGNTLYGKIGGGNVSIKLESVNGELGLRRRQDGKNPNPVTNLLGAAGDEDAYKEIDESVEAATRDVAKIKIPKIDAEVQRAMRDAQKEISKAKIKVNIDKAKLNESIRVAMEQQRIAMQNMRDAGWMRGGMSKVERKSETFNVKGKPKVTIDAKNYSVFVRGWDRQEVQYTVTQISSGSSSVSDQPATVDHSDSEVKIRMAESSSSSAGMSGAGMSGGRLRIEVFVPRKSDLKIMTRGEVRLENVSGELDVQGGEESIDVRDSEGNLIVAAEDGRIRVIGFRGVVDAKGGDGLMSLEGDFKELSAQAASGKIILTLPENANALIESNQTELIGEGVILNRQKNNNDFSVWKVGSGGQNYSLKTEDGGKIFVRGANSLKTE